MHFLKVKIITRPYTQVESACMWFCTNAHFGGAQCDVVSPAVCLSKVCAAQGTGNSHRLFSCEEPRL